MPLKMGYGSASRVSAAGASGRPGWEGRGDGTSVTLTANPQAGSNVTWSGACTGNALTCTLTMDSDKTVAARFQP